MNTDIANIKDAPQIAKIHYEEINQGFLTQLGEKFLSKLYKAMIESPNSFIAVIKDGDNVVGFISGCINLHKFYGYFLKKYFFQGGIILLPKILNLRTIKKIIEVLMYPKQEKKKNLPSAELLTIAISKKFQKQGLTRPLFEKFIHEMKIRKIKTFKVIVGKKLIRAIKFYENADFIFSQTIKIHGQEISKVYIYNLN